jgi:hypothetical protein
VKVEVELHPSINEPSNNNDNVPDVLPLEVLTRGESKIDTPISGYKVTDEGDRNSSHKSRCHWMEPMLIEKQEASNKYKISQGHEDNGQSISISVLLASCSSSVHLIVYKQIALINSETSFNRSLDLVFVNLYLLLQLLQS